MDKVKSALHIGSKSKEERIANHPATGGASSTVPSHTGTGTHTGAAHTGAAHTGFDDDYQNRDSYDSELEGMTPDERIRYLKEHDYAEKHDEPKKGSFLEKLIAKGNKKTEDDLAEEARMAEAARARQAQQGVIR